MSDHPQEHPPAHPAPDPTPPGAEQPDGGQQGRPVVVVTGDGMAVASEGARAEATVGAVEEPAKVMRIGAMVKQLLEEVRSAPLDEAGRARLAQVHERSIAELEQGLSPDLVAELRRVALPFVEGVVPSDAELRIAQAQLVGWLEGLFHGIQTALFAQQMAARAQIEQMRRALPQGAAPGGPVMGAPGPAVGAPGQVPPGSAPSTGQYL